MKIISKYKDYYDYLQGVYGVDPKVTLDRTKSNNLIFSGSPGESLRIYICDHIIDGVFCDGKMRFGKDIGNYLEEYKSKYGNFYDQKRSINVLGNEIPVDPKMFTMYENGRMINHHLNGILKVDASVSPNVIYKCPIMMHPYFFHNDDAHIHKYPILEKLNIPSIIPAHDIWVMLSGWITNNSNSEIEGDILSNKEKILAGGFDLKTSFRNM